jgi:glycosyltransferase involved in cell wall biosynthesis
MAPEPKPLVSVIIAVKNGLPYIIEAVESALAQGPLLDQAIVVDDGSTDGTLEALAALRDPRLSLIRSAESGVSAARNSGAALARAPWLLFLDADDRLTKGAVDHLVSSIQDELVLVYGDYERIDGRGRSFGKRGFLRGVRSKPSGQILEALLAQNLFINGGILICAREAFQRVGGFERGLSLCEDWHLWCRLAAIGPAGYVPERVLDYRVHPTSVMMRKRRTYEEFVPALGAIYSDARIRGGVAPGRLSRLRRHGEVSLMTYCAQQALRAGSWSEVAKMALTAMRRDPRRGPWVFARLAGAWASL